MAELHPACIACKAKNSIKRDVVDEDGNLMWKKGDFPINCSGIPVDYEDSLAEKLGSKERLSLFREEDRETMLQGLDPTRWASKWLLQNKGGWYPRGANPDNVDKYDLDPEALEYQEIMLKCTADRKVFRIGRRAGKSEAIAVRILHSLVTWPGGDCKVLLVCPYKAQIEIIFKRIKELINDSPTLQNSIKRAVSSPYHEIEMYNGSYIRGFSAGTQSGSNASSVRGQAADIIVLDEMDYLNPGDIDSITAILMDHPNTQMWASSTPTGRRDKFFEFCHAPEFREFYFPSMCNPSWSHKMEKEFKRISTKSGYIHEVLAEFGDEDIGVFKKTDIDHGLALGANYQYGDQRPARGWTYTIGVDWNPVVGTEIIVVGARQVSDDPADVLFRVVDVKTIERQEFTERAANLAIIDMNRRWAPIGIYLDYGGGGVNHLEQLRLFSAGHPAKSPEGRLRKITKVIDFGKSIEIRDPYSRQKLKKPMKPFMVENAVRKMEQRRIELSSHDNVLTTQMQNYIIAKQTLTGRPVYGLANELVGDHRLDAWLLAMLAFQMEATSFGKPRYEVRARLSPRFGEDLKDSTLKAIGDANNAFKEELKSEVAAKPRSTGKSFRRKTMRQKTQFAETEDHERAWDAELARQRDRRVSRAGRGRANQSPGSKSRTFLRGMPRRKNI